MQMQPMIIINLENDNRHPSYSVKEFALLKLKLLQKLEDS